ncbi:MAG: hydroxymethylbilane synthase, partial [Persicimonas sp.]
AELDPDAYVPAVGQGAIGLETREGREDVDELLEPILDPETVEAVEAERIVMNRLEGGCSVPLGAHCRRVDDTWHLKAWVGSPDGRQTLVESAEGADARAMARTMAQALIDRGARDILDSPT